jgi:hypothetical protein
VSPPRLYGLPLNRARANTGAVEEGGIGKVYQVFGQEFDKLLDELNEVLAA